LARILIAEDSPTQAAQLTTALANHGFDVSAAGSGEEGLSQFNGASFDLVISDVVMPGMSGYEFCRRLKAHRSRGNVPVILLTSLHEPMDIIQGLESGADNFMTKPYRVDELIHRVEQLLDNRRMRAESRVSLGIDIMFLGRKFTISSDKEQILDLLLSTFEDTVRANHELQRSKAELAAAKSEIQRYAVELEQRVSDRTAALSESERRFQDIAEASADWLWETDTEHRYATMGQSPQHGGPLELLLGHTRWDLAGGDIVNDDNWRRHKEDLDAHRPFRDFRYTTTYPHGQFMALRVSGKPIFNETGEFRGYRGASTNETAIVEALTRAEDAEALFRDAIESFSGGVIICDAADRIAHSNGYMRDRFPECAELLRPGVSFEEFTRAVVAAGNYPDAVGRENEWIAERMSAHRAAAGATEYRQRSRWVLVTERRMSNGGISVVGIDITGLKQAQAALAASEGRLDRAQAIAGIGSWEIDLETSQLLWSKEMYRLRGMAPGECEPSIADILSAVATVDQPRVRDWYDRLGAGKKPPPIEFRLARRDGEPRSVIFEGTEVWDAGRGIVKIAGTARDVTSLRATERQLIHAQRMEAVGNLTGGMAHDFNNLLGVIIGNVDILRTLVKGNAELEELAGDALEAALKGADLTRRLLAFARRQPLQPERVSANELIANITRLLSRTLGEAIKIKVELASDLWPVYVDPAQLEAAITNLATNARDAMSRGGMLSITTRNTQLDAEYASRHTDLESGNYIAIEITDTGEGIPPEIIGRIFDPFFTTKEQGKGTGLGLSMVFGFVKQSGGHINVYSEPGIGTTFRLYLPQASAEGAAVEKSAVCETPPCGGETVLVVEDNAALRRISVRLVQSLGYKIIEAENADAALAAFEREQIDLLFTDVVMPGQLNGFELAREATARRPPLKVLLTSGFPDTKLNSSLEGSKIRLLCKPYRVVDLADAIRAALDRDGEERGPGA
jgi:signal transduction histidine kinase/DNA-binding response OmpR family regulator